MKKNAFTIYELIAVIVVLSAISLISYTCITNIIKKNSEKRINDFNDILINSAELYLNENKADFPNFNRIGDVALITSSELIDENYLKEDISNPTSKKITDFYIKAKINSDRTISYEVVG